MIITIKNLKVAEFLSEETLAYSATIYVDGAKAFAASNQGHGGCDMLHTLPGYQGPSEREVSAWLKANRPAHTSHGITLEHDLELEIGELIAKQQAEAKVRRLLKSRICVLKDGALHTYPTKYKPTPANLAAVAKQGHHVLNGDDDGFADAVKAYAGGAY